MTKRFYFDTSVWLDFYEKRGKNGEYAFRLIVRIINEDCKIAYSDLNIKELKHLDYIPDEIDKILSLAKPGNKNHIHIYREQVEEGRRLARQRKIPNKDALHAILCRDNRLQLIARDLHFEKIKDIANAKKPEELI